MANTRLAKTRNSIMKLVRELKIYRSRGTIQVKPLPRRRCIGLSGFIINHVLSWNRLTHLESKTSNMQDHIKDLLLSYQYPDEVKDEAAFRVIFGGESCEVIMAELGIANVHTISNWVKIYKDKIEAGLITLPPMTAKQQQDNVALNSRIKELEKSLKTANLIILALNTMIDIAEKDLKIPIRKKPGTKRS